MPIPPRRSDRADLPPLPSPPRRGVKERRSKPQLATDLLGSAKISGTTASRAIPAPNRIPKEEREFDIPTKDPDSPAAVISIRRRKPLLRNRWVLGTGLLVGVLLLGAAWVATPLLQVIRLERAIESSDRELIGRLTDEEGLLRAWSHLQWEESGDRDSEAYTMEALLARTSRRDDPNGSRLPVRLVSLGSLRGFQLYNPGEIGLRFEIARWVLADTKAGSSDFAAFSVSNPILVFKARGLRWVLTDFFVPSDTARVRRTSPPDNRPPSNAAETVDPVPTPQSTATPAMVVAEPTPEPALAPTAYYAPSAPAQRQEGPPDSTSSTSVSPFPGERFPETRSCCIDEAFASGLSRTDLQYAINEMFARHGGYISKDDARRPFERFAWYRSRPGVDFDQIEDREFSDIEKANLKLLGAARDGTPLPTEPSPARGTTALPSNPAPPAARAPQAFHHGTWVMRRTDQNAKDTDYLTNTLRIDGSRFSYLMRFKSVLKPGAPPWTNPKIRHLKTFSGETVYRGSIVRVTQDEIHARVESVDWPAPSPLDNPRARMEGRAKVGVVWRYAFRDGVLVDARNASSVFRRP